MLAKAERTGEEGAGRLLPAQLIRGESRVVVTLDLTYTSLSTPRPLRYTSQPLRKKRRVKPSSSSSSLDVVDCAGRGLGLSTASIRATIDKEDMAVVAAPGFG